MADVVDLANFRDPWIAIAIVINDTVREAGHDQAIADWVLADMKMRNFQVVHVSTTAFDHFPEDVRLYLAEISHTFKDTYGNIMAAWIVRIIQVEIELYLARTRPAVTGCPLKT